MYSLALEPITHATYRILDTSRFNYMNFTHVLIIYVVLVLWFVSVFLNF